MRNHKNRFNISHKKNIRFFVEDNTSNAKKLSTVCETVFLLDHPYNNSDGNDLPANVVRVKSWEEIHHHLHKNLMTQNIKNLLGAF